VGVTTGRVENFIESNFNGMKGRARGGPETNSRIEEMGQTKGTTLGKIASKHLAFITKSQSLELTSSSSLRF